MKLFVAVATVSLLALSCAQTPPVDLKCVEDNCKYEYAGCTGDAQCSETLNCVTKCWDEWNLDPTPQKYKVQNCTNKCVYTYGNKYFTGVLLCLSLYHCLHLPPTPNECKGNDLKVIKNISFEDVGGTWWTLRGYNPVYDCYPCMRSTLTYTYFKQSFKVFLVNGQLKLVDFTSSVEDNAPLPGFNTTLDLGLKTTATFWPVDIIEDEGNKYILLYYCAIEDQWYYDGAYVVSPAKTMSANAMQAARTSFRLSVGLELDTFCSPSLTDCPLVQD